MSRLTENKSQVLPPKICQAQKFSTSVRPVSTHINFKYGTELKEDALHVRAKIYYSSGYKSEGTPSGERKYNIDCIPRGKSRKKYL